MNKKEYVETMFDEAKHEMRKYFTTLPENSKFEEFELQYDNEINHVILFVKFLDKGIEELDRWGNFNLTDYKHLISLANDFTKSDNYKLWEYIPILVSMRI